MEFEVKYSLEDLQRLSYRTLQQMAKAMNLPSNVKKVYLIQLVYAKTNKTSAEVESIVQTVKLERQKVTVNNRKKKGKKNIQTMEITSTNSLISPPIDLTSKRSKTPDSSDKSVKFKSNSAKSITNSRNGSDRVLRSYNRSYKKPNYCLLNNSLINVIDETESRPKQTHIRILSREGKIEKLKLTAHCALKTFKPNILRGPSSYRQLEELVPVLSTQSMLVPVRNVSTFVNFPSRTKNCKFQSIGYRHTDGKISKIKAVVQRNSAKEQSNTTDSKDNYIKAQVSVQDIINNNIDAQEFTTSSITQLAHDFADATVNYPNMSRVVDPVSSAVYTHKKNNDGINDVGIFSMYHHKKIRSEQVRNRRLSAIPYPPYPSVIPRNVANEQSLPKLSDVFSKFNNRDLTQPIYVQVYNEDNYRPQNPSSSVILEKIYTLRSENAPPVPLLQRATTANTNCVYTNTKPLTTAAVPMPHYSTVAVDPYYYTSVEQNYPMYANTSEEVSRICDLAANEQDMTLRSYQEAANTTCSSLDSTLRDVGATPDIEDAMEMISQDGDYMDRISLDVRMQCILCSWAGPKFILEYHIRAEHESQIMKQEKDDWVVTYKLGTLIDQDVWLSQVSERSGILYMLSVKYEHPNWFLASLTSLSAHLDYKVATITLYNKVTGQPFIWRGTVQELPSNMPYENTNDLFKINLHDLELLPNNSSLNSKSILVNSPSKVLGQNLNDIHIIVFVKIQDF